MAATHVLDMLMCWMDVAERSGPATTAAGESEGGRDEGDVAASRGGVATDARGEGGDGGMGGGDAGLWLWLGFDVFVL